MTELRVRKPDGWTTVSFPDDVAAISVVGGKVDGQLCLTLTGEREDGPRIVETGILDVDETDEHLLENTVPRTEDGTSVVLDRLLPE
ncbi:hypothetical protein Har1130_19040 [Haloarcula sp. CBA1130]|uniref:hypothetical protein n=1 Tax=unclassified Haloarcula TaxID=2624677 RepID=UPI001246A755|nr:MULTISPECIES: hypothetical protein [unclassified Haloarcula]KAA9396239.1 hypothetical protein Har1129_17825 [Haloarcula sp. CBA1129]KAA9396377.1 hypothetical protein Har1130_19040 [Haloarcula sp. CBA1130]KAA9397451.1 hypothetical protein Har1129_03975 [Haloarcula sp. CBA1129]